jgi:hypothetical protein
MYCTLLLAFALTFFLGKLLSESVGNEPALNNSGTWPTRVSST